jgi:hypothetical protein
LGPQVDDEEQPLAEPTLPIARKSEPAHKTLLRAGILNFTQARIQTNNTGLDKDAVKAELKAAEVDDHTSIKMVGKGKVIDKLTREAFE